MLKYDAVRVQCFAEGRVEGPRDTHFSARKRAIAEKVGRSEGDLEAQIASRLRRSAVSSLAPVLVFLTPEIAPEGAALSLNAPDLRAIRRVRGIAEGLFAEGAQYRSGSSQ